MTMPNLKLRVSSFGRFLSDIRAVTDHRAKIALVTLIPLSVLAAVIELGGIILVVPLLSVLSANEGMGGSITRWVAQRIGSTDQTTLATVLAFGVFAAFLVRTAVTLAIRWWSFGALAESEARTASRLFDSYLNTAYEYHVARNSSEALRNLTESVPDTYQQTLIGVVGLVSEGTVVMAITALIFAAAPLAASGLMVYFLLIGVVYARIVVHRVPTLGLNQQETVQEGLSLMTQTLGAIKQIIAMNKQERFSEQFRDNRDALAEVRRKVQFILDVPRYYLEMAFVSGVVLLTLVVLHVDTSQRALGVLVLFFAAGLRLLPSVNRLVNAITATRLGRSALRIVANANRELRATERSAVVEDGWSGTFAGPLIIDGVTYRYESRMSPALNRVSISVPPGGTLGIVGPSGAGKSTLIDVVLALYRPQEGQILAGGVNVFDHPRAWRERVGFVPQDVHLLDVTLRENIAFGESPEDIDEVRIERSIKQAELVELVGSLPDGLNTKVGERGLRLSGGQRQRVGIARALYMQPSLLLFDEATSALDGVTEQRVTETINALRGTVTIMIVAHRLSTVRDCDQIAFLVDGSIRGVGSFDELMSSDAEFAELVRRADVRPVPGTEAASASDPLSSERRSPSAVVTSRSLNDSNPT